MKNKKPSETISRAIVGEVVAPPNLPPDLVQLTKEWRGLTYEQKVTDAMKRPLEGRLRLLQSVGGICKNAIQVVQDFRPLIEVCRNELSQPGCRIPLDGRPTWTKFIPSVFGFSARRMQQLLAGGSASEKSSIPRQVKTRTTINPGSDELLRKVAALAITLARSVVQYGLVDKFPEATEILTLMDSKGTMRVSMSGSSANGQQSDFEERQQTAPLTKNVPRQAAPVEGMREQVQNDDRKIQPQPDCYICDTGIHICAMHEPQHKRLMERGLHDLDASDILREQCRKQRREFSTTA
jgi:hypothetical protein